MMKIKILTKYRFGLAILASLIVIIAFGWGFLTKTQVTKATLLTWQPARQVVESALLQKVLTENFQPVNSENFPDLNQVKVVTLAAENKYFIFDFHTLKVCGTAGCLYSAYTTDGQNILSLMLNPQLPKGFSLLVQSAEKRNGYPCLDVFQQNSHELVSSSHFCLNSGELVLLNQSLKEIKL
ncbi:hypothetical protein ACE1CI_27905 [Aerosakkonemataceae cyanobacterium BLCC-F50]|uniref:Uncharacterized protein n=1 Tax=Floridaenema flaviceps BLCC-F50 TaxID=3153642 RepID=A0ABV4XYD6_9CYAN